MRGYKLNDMAKMDLARIYWRGRRDYTEAQADQYYAAFIERFEALAEAPYSYPVVDHIREGYRRSVCGVDSIYYRLDGNLVEIMRVLGRQDVDETL